MQRGSHARALAPANKIKLLNCRVSAIRRCTRKRPHIFTEVADTVAYSPVYFCFPGFDLQCLFVVSALNPSCGCFQAHDLKSCTCVLLVSLVSVIDDTVSDTLNATLRRRLRSEIESVPGFKFLFDRARESTSCVSISMPASLNLKSEGKLFFVCVKFDLELTL